MKISRDVCYDCGADIVWVKFDSEQPATYELDPKPYTTTADAIVVRRVRGAVMVEEACKARPVPTSAHHRHPCMSGTVDMGNVRLAGGWHK